MVDATPRCVNCGAELPTAGTRRYCTNACRQRAYRQRRSGGEPARDSTTIPLALDGFIGRRSEIATVRKLLRQGRLVTLFGPAGAGKTRLALEIANRLGHEFTGGARLVEL